MHDTWHISNWWEDQSHLVKSQNIFQSYKITPVLILIFFLVEKINSKSNVWNIPFYPCSKRRLWLSHTYGIYFWFLDMTQQQLLLSWWHYRLLNSHTKMALALSFLQLSLPQTKDWELPLILYVSMYQDELIQMNFLFSIDWLTEVVIATSKYIQWIVLPNR